MKSPWRARLPSLRRAALHAALLLGACASDGGSPVAPDAALDSAAVEDSALPDATEPDAAPVTRELPLIDHAGWRSYDSALDPLQGHQPPSVDCGRLGWYIERGQLEISTVDCNYALLEHPSLLAIAEGTEVLAELWYFDLVAPEPAEAHVALLFGDALQWETLIAIPQPGNVRQVAFRATRALAVGESIRLHLHNHGQNTWLLRSMVAVVPAP